MRDKKDFQSSEQPASNSDQKNFFKNRSNELQPDKSGDYKIEKMKTFSKNRITAKLLVENKTYFKSVNEHEKIITSDSKFKGTL